MSIVAGVDGCSDHGCIWGHPGGMGTNGGCNCLKSLRYGLTLDDVRKFQRNIHALRARVAELEAQLSERGKP